MTNHHIVEQPRRPPEFRIPAIDKYAYCLCLHVKPTTIFIAVFKLIRSLLFASILLNTEFTLNEHSEYLTLDDRHRSTAVAVSIFSRIIVASVSALAIYAVVSGRAALLMPLYAVLLVDFFFALPAIYSRDPDAPIQDHFTEFKNYPHRDNQIPRISLMLVSVITMIARIYFLCVIWKCYRYLRLIELITPIRLTEVYPHITRNIQYPVVRVIGSADSTDIGPGCGNIAPPSYDSIAASMKPPNYEEAIKSSEVILPPTTIIDQNQQNSSQHVEAQKDNSPNPQHNSNQLTQNNANIINDRHLGERDSQNVVSLQQRFDAPIRSEHTSINYPVTTNHEQGENSMRENVSRIGQSDDSNKLTTIVVSDNPNKDEFDNLNQASAQNDESTKN